MDYSKTVFLPKTDFPMKADLPKREPEFLARWESEKVYEAGIAKRQGKTSFVLHDGPPYANGHLHLGHALNKILKDLIVRSKTMAGFYAPYVPGWDCHGLPIELQLMKELKIDKHHIDREKFRQQAADYATKFVGIQREEFKRMGVLGDWDHPYLTMAPEYKQTIVDCFKELEANGYVYRGKKPVYWCSTDETALAEAEVEYEDDKGPSIFVAFPREKAVNEFFVIWTTTPWTLPANVAIAMHPNESYVRWAAADGRVFILAEKLIENFQTLSGLTGSIKETLRGEDLSSMTARHPWIADRQIRVIPADFVAMDTGTGLVHIAPGHGREDFVVGQKFDLPVISPVSDRGLFTDEVPEWKGEHVFKANPKILEFLKEKGLLLYSGELSHSYPHCWRCHRPVIFRATEQWFLNIDHNDLRARLLKAVDGVQWIPGYGENRIRGMIEARPDWCLSRQRFWGTEIPEKGGRGEGETGRKDPDIVDVWFESGVSWAAVLKKRPELHYPADMYLEGSDQHRGWFQTSLIPSVALEGQAPFKTVLTHGFVMDGQGRPMSKSLGNVMAPEEIIKQYGADVLRLWVAASDYGGDVRLSPEIVKGLTESYRKIRNTFRFLLGNLDGYEPSREELPYEKLLPIDQWALGVLADEIRKARTSYEAYEFHRVTARMVQVCSTFLSGYYLDILKDRLYCDTEMSTSRRAARTVVHHLATTLIRLWAPILPFTCDEAWRALGHAGAVHLEDLPEPDPSWVPHELNELFPVRDVVLEALEKARQAGLIKGNLEAHATLYASQALMAEYLRKHTPNLSSLFLISHFTFSATPLSTVDLEKNGVQVHIEKASGQKCARCWIFKADVGRSPSHPDVCVRCADAVGSLV